MSAPMSQIYIVSDVPLDNRYEHSLYFENRTEQEQYFTRKIVKYFFGYTYLRKNWSIKVEASMSEAHRWTYLFFENTQHENKNYFYFINKVNYVNENTVELDLELDVIQTYLFDWDMKECFVEREHTASDDIGEHTVEEGLETGPLMSVDSEDVRAFQDMCIMYLTTMDTTSTSAVSNVYDGVFSGLRAYAIQMEDHVMFGQYLDSLAENGKIDAIVAMWMYPKNVVRVATWTDDGFNRVLGAGYDDFTVKGLSDVKSKLFEGYTPKNNKLYSYPFNFLYVSNNSGGSAVYRYERFTDPDEIEFGCAGAIAPDASVKIYPYGYNGASGSYEEGLELGSFPSCAWDSDVYKVWLAQNQNSQNLAYTQAKIQAGAGALTAIGSAFMGNLTGAVGGAAMGYNALMSTQQMLAQRADMDVQPSQARGNHSTNVNVANGKQTFTMIYKCVSREFAKIIDDYFTKYGYQVNRVKYPNIHNRDRYTYVKTVGCTVAGAIGNEDRLKIESVFDKGITFWADTVNPCDYTAENNCL